MRSSRPPSTEPYRRLAAAAVAVAAVAGAAWLLVRAPGVDAEMLLRRVAWPLARLTGIMALTLAASAVLEGYGWSAAVARFTAPLMRLGNLGHAAGEAYTAAFLSGVAGSTLLQNAYEEGRIGRRELILAVLMNHGLPSYVLHLPPTLAVILPLAGSAGLVYVGLTFAAALIRTFGVLLAGRLLLPRPAAGGAAPAPGQGPGHGRGDHRRVRRLLHRYLLHRLRRITLYTVPIYMLVVAAQQWGVFRWLQAAAARHFTAGLIPVEGVSVVVFSVVAEFAAGAAAAGAMLREGILTRPETVLALLLGNVIATPLRALRHQLAHYLGVFRPGRGIFLLALGQAIRVASVLAVGLAYYLATR
ncbi:nucleoside recognition domain-containing protein [Dissulfurirhabdus thermomarina]|uniref:Nucleoside recognition domain-containing protein n=1 Tax=Dissulfurirhabdus thermomarina TaxID=1765737 RepID=A0A6N9TS29_DISTH|nr:nucleoside recognition domain-containing protein [Dissulfurirhabdus thermomarina]NDY42564.1 nucleoside recognition domain-containing protein [Dissulfurirhabdus thermomarina]NMX23173.1 nucleoside recognition domain-containing protein [Dissulfurirhabdus thermomarina]